MRRVQAVCQALFDGRRTMDGCQVFSQSGSPSSGAVWLLGDEVLLVTAGLEDGDRLITTVLEAVTDGLPVRLADGDDPDDASGDVSDNDGEGDLS